MIPWLCWLWTTLQPFGCLYNLGMGFKMRGRVGDSPIIGAGLYVDNEVGACTGSGQGEEVIRIAGAAMV